MVFARKHPFWKLFVAFVRFCHILCRWAPHLAVSWVLQRHPELSSPPSGRVKKAGWAQGFTPCGPRANTGIHGICSTLGLPSLLLIYHFFVACAAWHHGTPWKPSVALLLPTLWTLGVTWITKWTVLGPRKWSKCCPCHMNPRVPRIAQKLFWKATLATKVDHMTPPRLPRSPSRAPFWDEKWLKTVIKN